MRRVRHCEFNCPDTVPGRMEDEMSDQELYESMTLDDEPFEVEECEPEYPRLPEDCRHEHSIGVSRDGEFWQQCLDCGLEF